MWESDDTHASTVPYAAHVVYRTAVDLAAREYVGKPERDSDDKLSYARRTSEPVGFTGCENLAFSPSISTSPDTSNADTPAGLKVEVKPAVGGLENTEGLSTADLKNTTVLCLKVW